MKARLILAGLTAVLAASAAHAVNDKIELMPGGVICDKGDRGEGEGERAKKITKHLFQSPAPEPR